MRPGDFSFQPNRERRDTLLCDRAKKRSLELRNQQNVIRMVSGFSEEYEGRTAFTVGVLEALHRLTVQDIYPCAGNIRRHYTKHVDVTGATFKPANPDEIAIRLPDLMGEAQRWQTTVGELSSALDETAFAGYFNKHRAACVFVATKLFYDFMVMHPFQGGNGRVGRAFLHLLFYDMKLLTPPGEIYRYIERRRSEYFKGLKT